MDDLLTPPEAAALLGVTRQAALAYIKRGQLPATRVGARTWLIRRADVAAFVPPKGGWPRGRPRKRPEEAADSVAPQHIE